MTARRARHASGVVILAGISAALHVAKLPPAIPALQQSLGIGLVQAGFLLSTVQFAGMALGILIGLLVDGVGLRRSLLGGLLLLTLASAAGALATSAGALLLLRLIEGLGFMLAALPGPSLLRRLVAPPRLPAVLGFWGAYMPFATALALLLGPWWMEALGWRAWWLLLAAGTALMAFWVWRALPADAAAAPVARAGFSRRLAASWPLLSGRLRRTLGAAGPWRVALGFATYSGPWIAVVGFLPALYAQAGVRPWAAGGLSALVAAGNIVGNIAAGQWLQRGVAPRRLLWAGYAAMALGACLFFVPATEGLPALRYAAVLAFSLCGGVVPGTLFSQAVRVAPGEDTVATTIGWMQQCSSFGQFVLPPLVAWVASAAGGWQWTWVVTGASAAAGAALAWRR
ncbi:MFS transporter [Xylophilus sp. ASV27]|uniref:MFS transporter n=1 Tax=Xylophilus sp. ASV27 TaxID=2795129 RepID=UPI00351C1145